QRRAAQQNDQWRDRQNQQAQQQEQLQRAQRAEQDAQFQRAQRAQQEAQFQRAQRAGQEAALQRERAEREAQLARWQRQAESERAYERVHVGPRVYSYRYNIGGVYRETDQYGADLLRQAINQGYEQGYRDGSIDRDEGAPANFGRALDLETGGFGYTGVYVPQS